jgi:hypothetical protein
MTENRRVVKLATGCVVLLATLVWIHELGASAVESMPASPLPSPYRHYRRRDRSASAKRFTMR